MFLNASMTVVAVIRTAIHRSFWNTELAKEKKKLFSLR